MDTNGKDYSSDKLDVNNKPLTDVDSKTVLLNGERKVDDDTASLLPPRKGGLSRKLGKPQRKVQWKDNNGNKLTEVVEFQSSDVSDSDDEESDSCICIIL